MFPAWSTWTTFRMGSGSPGFAHSGTTCRVVVVPSGSRVTWSTLCQSMPSGAGVSPQLAP
ncbi:hypothetical protein GCM10010431_57150 [Streptomyces kunmingensis]